MVHIPNINTDIVKFILNPSFEARLIAKQKEFDDELKKERDDYLNKFVKLNPL